MWADELSSDNKYAVALAIGRIGELVADLSIDHVALVAVLADPVVTAEGVLLELQAQIEAHQVFLDRIGRIRSNLEGIAVVLEQTVGKGDAPGLAM